MIHAATAWMHTAAAIGPDTRRGQRFGAFGLGSCISHPTGAIFGESNIWIGSGVMIGVGTTMSAGFGPGQNLGDKMIVRIGDRALIGRGSHIVGHDSIEIGADVYTGPYVYITDQNHSYADPDLPIGRQWPTNQPVRIGAGSWLGTGAVVLPGADIGENVVVAAGSIVRGKVPSHSVVAGMPARVVRQWNPEDGWVPPIPSQVAAAALDEEELQALAEAFGLRVDQIGVPR